MLIRDLGLNGVMVSLGLPPAELHLINSPDASLLGLNPSEVFVEGEVVTDRILEKEIRNRLEQSLNILPSRSGSLY